MPKEIYFLRKNEFYFWNNNNLAINFNRCLDNISKEIINKIKIKY